MPARERGLGHAHQKLRRAMLPAAYGRPCELCGMIMYPHQSLDLDHVLARALQRSAVAAQQQAGRMRIVHSRCNRRRGAILGNYLRWQVRRQPPRRQVASRSW